MLNCAQVQAALSARLDGEDSGVPDDILDAHLSGCRECQRYYDKAAALNRVLAFQDVGADTDLEAPDLSASILEGLEPERRKQVARFVLSDALVRMLLVLFGSVYVAWAIALLTNVAALPTSGLPAGTLVATDDPLLAGLLFDAAAFRFAMAFGLFFAAWRPQASGGLFPVFGALFTFSLGFGVRDMVLGFATAGDLGGLVLLLATAALVLVAWIKTMQEGTVPRLLRSLSANPLTES
ncbi:zf-HC2 domain-containing protein [Corynebacterium sp. H128]|uniref:zf-HC2 domain-containing protein n=1 Tax=unclassified Corynebacterium TaxID=2624378 RepID=UPI0030AF8660